jgi:hypothetical protein
MTDPINTEPERKKLRQMAADHAAYEIAHGLRELLYWSTPVSANADEHMREGAERLRGGLCEALLFLTGEPR